MGKVKLLLDVIGDLRSLADSLQAVADAVADNGAAEAGRTDTKEPEKEGKAGKAAKKEEKPVAKFAESKNTNQSERPQPMPQTDSDGFMSIPDGIDEELPFN